jgi:hypothetical protein
MGVAYFIVLNKKNPGFNVYVSGRALGRELRAIARITKKLKLPNINDLTSFANLAVSFGANPKPDGAKHRWFDASEGLHWIDALYEYIDAHKRSVEQRAAVLEDLDEYKLVLTQAQTIKAKWHFEMDI